MTFLPETEEWVPVTQLETSDEVKGGADGASNRAPGELTKRDAWLKAQVAANAASIAANAADITANEAAIAANASAVAWASAQADICGVRIGDGTDYSFVSTLPIVPWTSSLVGLYDGQRWVTREVPSGVAKNLAGLAGVFDLFLAWSGAITVEHRSWTDATTRADALGTQDGVRVLESDPALRWIGTIATVVTGQTTNDGGARLVWNARHRTRARAYAIEATASWVATGDGFWHPFASAPGVSLVVGEAQEVAVEVTARAKATAGVPSMAVGVGVDGVVDLDGRAVYGDGDASTDRYTYPRASCLVRLGAGKRSLAPYYKATANLTLYGGTGYSSTAMLVDAEA